MASTWRRNFGFHPVRNNDLASDAGSVKPPSVPASPKDPAPEPSQGADPLLADLLEESPEKPTATEVEAAKGEVSTELQGWLQKSDFNASEKVAAVTGIYNQLGVKETAESLMNQYFSEGLKMLDTLDAPEDRKKVLKEFSIQLIERDK